MRPFRWIQRVTPLLPWMRQYALWLVHTTDAELTRLPGHGYRKRYPSNEDRVAEATRLAGRRIFPEWVRLLEQRADFRTYFERLRTRPRFRARQLAQLELVANIEARREALAEALRAGDIKAIEALTRWAIELALRPTRSRRKRLPPIVISRGQPAKRRSEPEPSADSDVEVELLESPDRWE